MKIMIFYAIIISMVFSKEYTLIVYEGDFYSTPELKFESKSRETVEASVKLSQSASQYMIPQGDEQQRCMSSWNKLWGYSRCYGSHHHKDSDRFVFRRAQNCLYYVQGVAHEYENCQDKNLIEVAAYAYDNGDLPYEHNGRLLKSFQTRISIEVWYHYRLTFLAESTIYELMDANKNLLETQVIQHRICNLHKNGYRLTLYFGGVCPSPNQIEGEYIE